MAANIDPDKISALIRHGAEQFIKPRFRNLSAAEIETKENAEDFVTIADRETEEFLESELPRLYPGSVVVGEEGVSSGRVSTRALLDKDLIVWVVDPVDGTTNFKDGKTIYACMVACVHGGEVKFGWIYDVPNDKMLLAEKGEGAFIEGRRLKVAPAKPFDEVKGFAADKYFPKKMHPDLKDLAARVSQVETLKCAGHEYTRVADGKADFSLYRRAKPWDHLAGTLAVQEAGGVVLKWDGTPYKPGDEGCTLVTASNDDLMRELQNGVVQKLLKLNKPSP